MSRIIIDNKSSLPDYDAVNAVQSERTKDMKAIHYNCAKKHGWNGEKYCVGQPEFALRMGNIFCEACGEQLFKEIEPYTWQSFSAMILPDDFLMRVKKNELV